MLKFTEASQARDRVVDADKSHAKAHAQLLALCGELHTLRSEVGRSLIAEVEAYINTLATRPKEFDRAFALYHHNLKQFDAASHSFGAKIQEAATVGSATAGVGVAAGAATAFGAPTAALAVATTFGTASTGTAISALSGAAATNAAVAWLGGGAIAAGGGGMVGGNALLALAGPVGLALAGTSAVAGLGWAAYKNRATIKEADSVYRKLVDNQALVEKHAKEVLELKALTTTHTDGLRQMFDEFVVDAPTDCSLFSERQFELVGALMNNVEALGRAIKMKPGEAATLQGPVQDSEFEEASPAPAEKKPEESIWVKMARKREHFEELRQRLRAAIAEAALLALSAKAGEGYASGQPILIEAGWPASMLSPNSNRWTPSKTPNPSFGDVIAQT